MTKLKIGIFGAGRGVDIAKNFEALGCEIVAMCDFHPGRMARGINRLGHPTVEYSDFDSFIEHEMDAVIVANYFNEHAPYAIRCLEKGIHVYSECLSNGTMAEGVELIRAAEKSNAIYMFGENYPQMGINLEMQRICAEGSLGKILFAEGEYCHTSDPMGVSHKKAFNYFRGHWRNYHPCTYYITHSLGPLMKATGATPKKVTAFAVYDPETRDVPRAKMSGDRSGIVMTQNDDGSVFRVTGTAGFGPSGNTYRICGTKGQIENLRGVGKLALRYNSWDKPGNIPNTILYDPFMPDKDASLIKASGHGGSDFVTARIFLECLEEGKQPMHPFDVHGAVAMSSTAILAFRSILQGGTFDIPDFHDEEARKQYENDRLSPFYGPDGSEPTIPCCSHPEYKPTEEQLRLYDDMVKDFY